MGKIKVGILGGFSGTVGTVIGGCWKGIDYMRSHAENIRNPRTEPQQAQRNKFAAAMYALRPLKYYLRIGFKEQAVRMTAFNAAFSYAIKNAIEGEFPEYGVDYSLLKVAFGDLTGVDEATATVAEGAITFAWSDNSGIAEAKATDVAMPLVYNLDKRICIYGTSPASRIEGTTVVSVPETWAGDTLVLYLAFQSMDGAAVSDSVYLGEEMAL